MNLVLFGPPGAGKGTQAQSVCVEYGLVHLSTGNLFRAHISNETPLGKEVKSILDAGELVPDSIVLNMVKEELQKPAFQKGVVFDDETTANLYFQDESRFGLKTHIGSCLIG